MLCRIWLSTKCLSARGLRTIVFGLRYQKAHFSSAHTFTSISFFRFVKLENDHVERIVKASKITLSDLNLRGTLLVSHEGFNGQFAIPHGQMDIFRSALTTVDGYVFRDLDINVGVTIDYADSSFKFPYKKLLVRKKKAILTDGLPPSTTLDWSNCGPELSPEHWQIELSNYLKSKNANKSDVPILIGEL